MLLAVCSTLCSRNWAWTDIFARSPWSSSSSISVLVSGAYSLLLAFSLEWNYFLWLLPPEKECKTSLFLIAVFFLLYMNDTLQLYTKLCLYEQRGTRIYKNISLIVLSKGAHSLLLVWERHILKEGTSSCPISSSWSQGVPTLAPSCKPYPQRRPRRLGSAAYPWFECWFSGLCLNMTAWFSYHVVSFSLHTCSTGLLRRTAILLFTNHNVTACQNTRGHYVP